MKSNRRHELRENVLAHELVNIKEFFSRYGNWILTSVTVVALVLVVWMYYRGRVERRFSSEKTDLVKYTRQPGLTEDERLDGLIGLAETAKDTLVGSRAAVRAGDFCSQKYLDAIRRSDSLQTQQWREKAERYYRLAIDKYPNRKPLAAKAYLGLGILAESAGDAAAAEANYDQVGRLVHAGFPAAIEARRRSRLLQGWLEPVRFATTTQSTQPASSPSTAPRPASTLPASAPAARP